MKILNDFQIKNIDEEQVLRSYGHRGQLAPLREELREIILQEIEEAHHLIHPMAVYDEIRVAQQPKNEIILDNGLVIRAGSAISLWDGLDYLAIALCTIGPELEERVNELFAKDEYPSALILDSIGSIASESAADHINYLICARATSTNMKTGPRQSPGYGSWEIEDQATLFKLFPAYEIGVKLTENCAMLPRKSVSFGVGIGQQLTEKATGYHCRHCGKHNCQYRL